MSASTAFALMSQRLAADAGDAATLHTLAGDKPASVIFFAPWTGTPLSGVPVDTLVPEVQIDTPQWQASGAVEGNTLTVRGVLYTITEVSADDGGMTRLLLRAP